MIHPDAFRLVEVNLTAVIADLIQPPYQIRRPAIVEDVPGVADWLRRYPEAGWQQLGDEGRREIARRLLYVATARDRGVFSDDRR